MRIHVETSSGMPITRQIAAQIRAQCASGTLQPGQRLPSVRALAAELAINQNTILRVYERLTAEGLLERRHGDGTFVADRVPTGQMKAQRQLLRQEIAARGRIGQDVARRRGRTTPVAGRRNHMKDREENMQTMNEPAIELRGLVKSYGTKAVLTGLELLVPKGSVVGLLGTNGAGKTTLIKCALGLIRPQSGRGPIARRGLLDVECRGQDAHRLRAAGHPPVSLDEGAATDRLHGRLLPELEP